MEFLLFILDFIKISIDDNFYLTLIIFIIFMLLYNAFGIPGNFIFVASTGYFFGIYLGFIISISTIVFGSVLFIKYISFIFKFIFPNITQNLHNKINLYISKSSIEYIIIFRIIPGPPLLIQNLILSILRLDIFKISVASFLGFTPFVFATVFVGNKFTKLDNIKNLSFNNIFSLNFILFLIFIFIILVIRIKFKKTKN